MYIHAKRGKMREHDRWLIGNPGRYDGLAINYLTGTPLMRLTMQAIALGSFIAVCSALILAFTLLGASSIASIISVLASNAIIVIGVCEFFGTMPLSVHIADKRLQRPAIAERIVPFSDSPVLKQIAMMIDSPMLAPRDVLNGPQGAYFKPEIDQTLQNPVIKDAYAAIATLEDSLKPSEPSFSKDQERIRKLHQLIAEELQSISDKRDRQLEDRALAREAGEERGQMLARERELDMVRARALADMMARNELPPV